MNRVVKNTKDRRRWLRESRDGYRFGRVRTKRILFVVSRIGNKLIINKRWVCIREYSCNQTWRYLSISKGIPPSLPPCNILATACCSREPDKMTREVKMIHRTGYQGRLFSFFFFYIYITLWKLYAYSFESAGINITNTRGARERRRRRKFAFLLRDARQMLDASTWPRTYSHLS